MFLTVFLVKDIHPFENNVIIGYENENFRNAAKKKDYLPIMQNANFPLRHEGPEQ